LESCDLDLLYSLMTDDSDLNRRVDELKHLNIENEVLALTRSFKSFRIHILTFYSSISSSHHQSTSKGFRKSILRLQLCVFKKKSKTIIDFFLHWFWFVPFGRDRRKQLTFSSSLLLFNLPNVLTLWTWLGETWKSIQLVFIHIVLFWHWHWVRLTQVRGSEVNVVQVVRNGIVRDWTMKS